MLGRFGDNGELWFEVELVAATGERFAVDALLDTGFTTGFLAINKQDLEALQWTLIDYRIKMGTAREEECDTSYRTRWRDRTPILFWRSFNQKILLTQSHFAP